MHSPKNGLLSGKDGSRYERSTSRNESTVNINEQSVLVTGGGSGLGLATAIAADLAGAYVIIADLASTDTESLRAQLSSRTSFVEADVTDAAQVLAAAESAAGIAPLRAVVHTAGHGGPVRLVDKDGRPGNAKTFENVIRTNLIGSFIVASSAASVMARQESVDGERGVIVLTASVAAYEGQIGQTAYAASKAGVVGMTLVAARDLSTKEIRVNAIAPGIMETPMLGRLRDDYRDALAKSVPHPKRFGNPTEFADLALTLVRNRYLNGETVRLDGAIRMPPR